MRHQWLLLLQLSGRTKEQKYTKYADWDYIKECAEVAQPLPLFGNGDVLTYEDYYAKKSQSGVAGLSYVEVHYSHPLHFVFALMGNSHWP